MYRIALCDDNLEYLELIKNRIREYCMAQLDLGLSIY